MVCLYNQVQTNPCATGFDGEVEDYGLEIQALPTSVSEKEIPLAKIFPNPTADIFTVKLNKHISTIKIELINFLGQTISLKNVENTNEIKVDIAGYAKGVYFMNLYLDEEKSVFKIIKK